MKFITTSGVRGSTPQRPAEEKVVRKQKELAHSSTTLLTISKSKFSKAKQTGVLTLMQPKWEGLNLSEGLNVTDSEKVKKAGKEEVGGLWLQGNLSQT